MTVYSVKTGYLQENCYLLEKENNCLLIDPGDDYEEIKKLIDGKNVVGILITHSHFDHVASVDNLVKEFNYPVYNLENLQVGENKIQNFSFELIETFGHTMDSVSYYFKKEKKMFTGDFLFYGTIGRCDFIESNEEEMLKSIQKISSYEDDITVYPGHGRSTTLGREKKKNPYFL